MQVKEIASSSNPLLKTVRSLHDRSGRKKSGLFLLEGAKLLEEALNNELYVQDIIVSSTFLKNGMPGMPQLDREELVVVEDSLFSHLATTETPQGVLATASMRTHELSDVLTQEKPLIVVSDAVQDPGNLGAIMRSALAFGATAMVLTKGTTDPYSPKAVRSAMGALFALPVVTDILLDDLIEDLRAHHVTIFALDQNADETIWNVQFPERLALLLGNEGNGMSDDDIAKADRVLAIPISPRSESLNVAITAGIVLAFISSKRAF
jgi:TrmH family RNA methyltransferase